MRELVRERTVSFSGAYDKVKLEESRVIERYAGLLPSTVKESDSKGYRVGGGSTSVGLWGALTRLR